MTRPHSIRCFRRASALLALVACGAAASAQWPDNPATPLHVGQAEGVFGPRQSMVADPDGSVWLAWQDSFCTGDLRLQHVGVHGELLKAGGLAVQEDPTCGFTLPPELIVTEHGAALSRALAGLDQYPVQSFTPTGDPLWNPAFSTDEVRFAGGLLGLANGDVMIVSGGFGFIQVDRVDQTGAAVWPGPLVFNTPNGANFAVFDVVPDGADGAYVFWDAPLTYRRVIWVMRITADGHTAWTEPTRPIPAGELQGSSRHTPPRAISDGAGGAVLVWVKGFETGSTPAPANMQRILPDGSLAFDVEGVRVSLRTERQFDPIVDRDPVTGDVVVAWRDGYLDFPMVYAQRLTLAGDRLWGDDGVAVTAIAQTGDPFDAAWWTDRLAVAVGGEDGVRVHRVDAQGGVAGDVWDISPVENSPSVVTRAAGDGLVVSWQTDGPDLNDLVVAQRLNLDGRLGDPACSLADVAAPFGVLDLADIGAFAAGFIAGDGIADVAEPFGVLDLADVQAFIGAFIAGCP